MIRDSFGPRGFGFVKFDHRDSTALALCNRYHTVADCIVEVKPAVPRGWASSSQESASLGKAPKLDHAPPLPPPHPSMPTAGPHHQAQAQQWQYDQRWSYAQQWHSMPAHGSYAVPSHAPHGYAPHHVVPMGGPMQMMVHHPLMGPMMAGVAPPPTATWRPETWGNNRGKPAP